MKVRIFVVHFTDSSGVKTLSKITYLKTSVSRTFQKKWLIGETVFLPAWKVYVQFNFLIHPVVNISKRF